MMYMFQGNNYILLLNQLNQLEYKKQREIKIQKNSSECAKENLNNQKNNDVALHKAQ